MITRGALQALIQRRLDSVLTPSEVARLMCEVDHLDNRWEEMSLINLKTDSCPAASCLDCWLDEELERGSEIKLYLKARRITPVLGAAEG